MHINLSARFRKIFFGFMLGAIVVTLCSMGAGSSIAHAQDGGTPEPAKHYTVDTLTLADGTIVKKHTINGPSMPPSGFEVERQAIELSASSAKLINGVPAYGSVLGCSGVSGGITVAYDDRSGYPNLYTGLANNGVMPLDDSSWGTWSDGFDTWHSNPLIASRMGLDGRTTPGTIDDYWYRNGYLTPEPYIRDGREQHSSGDALGDFMRTSQYLAGNADGDTQFYTYGASPSPNIYASASLANDDSARPFTCDKMASEQLPDGTLGIRNFYEARGYAVGTCYNQPTDNVVVGGFSLDQFRAEIDAGRPVLLGLEGHTVVGIGYDASSNLVYIHDGWDYQTYTMTWGGSYTGFPLLMVSIVHPVPVNPGDYTISGSAGVANATITYTGGSTTANSHGYYSFPVSPGWSGTVTPSKPGYTFEPEFREYENVPAYQTAQHYTAVSIPGSNIIQDPSFELGSPNPYWMESSTNFGTPLCDASCGGGAHTGSAWGWFGSTEQYPDETASLSQTVTIPSSSSASLDFYLSIGEAGVGSDTADKFTVKLDGTTVFSANATQINSYSAYIPISVNITAYADGASHVITFTSVTTGQVVSFHLDDVSLVSISGSSPPGAFNLSISRLGTGSGTVTSSPTGINCGSDCSEEYAYNTSVTLTATPATGSTFTGWSGGGCSGTGTCNVTLSAAITVTANFNLQTPMLSVSKTGTGSGTVASNPGGINCGTDCSEAYIYNTSVTLTATPFIGSDFTGWSGTCSGTGSCVVSMTAAKSVTATFAVTPVPTAPNLIRPRSNWVTNAMPAFSWSNIPNADHYEIVFAHSNTFRESEIVDTQVIIVPAFTSSTRFNDGKFYWHVRAYNALNQPGRWSSTRYFTIDTLPPLPPTLRLPANNVSTRGVPTFRWFAANSVTQYQFEIDNDTDFSNPVFSVIQRVPYRRPPGVLRGTYFWRVRAQDTAGNWSTWSEIFNVNILRPR